MQRVPYTVPANASLARAYRLFRWGHVSIVPGRSFPLCTHAHDCQHRPGQSIMPHPQCAPTALKCFEAEKMAAVKVCIAENSVYAVPTCHSISNLCSPFTHTYAGPLGCTTCSSLLGRWVAPPHTGLIDTDERMGLQDEGCALAAAAPVCDCVTCIEPVEVEGQSNGASLHGTQAGALNGCIVHIHVHTHTHTHACTHACMHAQTHRFRSWAS